MKSCFLFLGVLTLSSCLHTFPYQTKKSLRSISTNQIRTSIDDVQISTYHWSAGQVWGSFRNIEDTLVLDLNMSEMLQHSFDKLGISSDSLSNDTSLTILIDPKLRWRKRRFVKFLEEQKFEGNTILPIVCYNVSLEPEKSGGGGIGFVHETGNDRYHTAQELYLALFHNNELIFLRRAIRWDEKIVPAGTPITHEFPQEVLDTLMHMALEPLLKQMKKGR